MHSKHYYLIITFILAVSVSIPVLALPKKGAFVGLPPELAQELSIYKDVDTAGVYYIAPNKLTIDKNQFTSRRAFDWKILASGGARVQIVARLNFGDAVLAQAFRFISQDTEQVVRVKSLELRNPSLGGQLDVPELVSNVQLSFQGDNTDTTVGTRFILKIDLTKDGAEYWQEQIKNRTFFVTTSLKFEAKFADDKGNPIWVPFDRPMSLADLPPIGNPFDATGAIRALATIHGEEYFFAQFANCHVFLDAAGVREPTDTEITPDDPSMSADEIELYKFRIKDAFHNAQAEQRTVCLPKVNTWRGEAWLKKVLENTGIHSCNDRTLLKPWLNYEAVVSEGPEFLKGAKTQYDEFKKRCVPQLFKCVFLTARPNYTDDEGRSYSCTAYLKSPQELCFNQQDLTRAILFDRGRCQFYAERWDAYVSQFLPNNANHGAAVETTVSDAKSQETCVTMEQPIHSDQEFVGRVNCW